MRKKVAKRSEVLTVNLHLPISKLLYSTSLMYILCISLQIYSYVIWNDMAHTCIKFIFFLHLSNSFLILLFFCSVCFVTFLLIFQGNVHINFFSLRYSLIFMGLYGICLTREAKIEKKPRGWRRLKAEKSAA